MWPKRKKRETVPATNGKVLLVVDWDNLFLNLFHAFRPEEIKLSHRFKKLLEWIKSEIGEILGEHGFIFAPEHLCSAHQEICVQNNFRIMICPKKQTRGATGEAKEEDTVDETIIWFAKMMIRYPDVKFLCLVSGDDDFVELLEAAKRQDIKIALAPPTISSLSRSKKLIRLADKHPRTMKKMILRLDKL